MSDWLGCCEWELLYLSILAIGFKVDVCKS